MKKYKPSQYAEEVLCGTYTHATVLNWIKKGWVPENGEIERTPTGRAIIVIHDKPASNVDKLVAMMEAKYNGTKTA